MKQFKIDDDDLTQACISLREGNRQLAEGKKSVDGAKKIIAHRLKELRDIDLAALPIGEIVSVDKLLLIEIDKQNRFDEARFRLAEPAVYETFKKEFPMVKYKPLVT